MSVTVKGFQIESLFSSPLCTSVLEVLLGEPVNEPGARLSVCAVVQEESPLLLGGR